MLADEWAADEYAPPWYYASLGVPVMSAATYTSLAQEVCVFPAMERVKTLDAFELAKIIQLEAPLSLLGPMSERPSLQRRDSLLLSSMGDGDVGVELSKFERLLNALGKSGFELRLRPPDCDVVSFYLDGPNIPEWRNDGSVGTGATTLCRT
jgi:hypothetical protein